MSTRIEAHVGWGRHIVWVVYALIVCVLWIFTAWSGPTFDSPRRPDDNFLDDRIDSSRNTLAHRVPDSAVVDGDSKSAIDKVGGHVRDTR